MVFMSVGFSVWATAGGDDGGRGRSRMPPPRPLLARASPNRPRSEMIGDGPN